MDLLRQTLYDCTYMWSLKAQTQTQSTLMVSRGSRRDGKQEAEGQRPPGFE